MFNFPKITEEQWEELDFTRDEIELEFERTKVAVFRGTHAGFLGSLLCNMEFHWCLAIPTACVTGKHIYFNPVFFLQIPPATRLFALVHELWHVAYLHAARLQDRDPKIWNYACDTVINSLMKEDGFTWEGFEPWYDPDYKWEDGSEIIYERMIRQAKKVPKAGPMGKGAPTKGGDQETDQQGSSDAPSESQEAEEKASDDLGNLIEEGMVDMVPEQTPEQITEQAEVVQKAVMTAQMGGTDAGNIPGEILETIDKFVNPQLPWYQLLRRWFVEKTRTYRSYQRPSRRYLNRGMYMPTTNPEMSRLGHIAFFLDSSGSMTDEDLVITNSETKFVWEVLKPKKLSLFNFDRKVHKIREFKNNDRFEEIKVLGRGGTDLTEVRQWIMENKPELVVILTDFYVDPMEEGPTCPILWICTSEHPCPEVNVGTVVRMRT